MKSVGQPLTFSDHATTQLGDYKTMHGYGWFSYMRSGDEKPKVTRELLLRVLNYAKPYWWHIGGRLVTTKITTGAEVLEAPWSSVAMAVST